MNSGVILYCYDGFDEKGNPLTERYEIYNLYGFVSNGKTSKIIGTNHNNMFKELELVKCKLIDNTEQYKMKGA
jgi:hypothetical protein